MLRKLGRRIKLEYLKLIRSKGASSVIARSFAIGMFIEFITLPTMGLAFLLLYPLVKVSKGLFSVSLVGFALGKLILPFFFVINYEVGSLFVHTAPHALQGIHEFFSLESLSKNGLVYLSGSAVNGVWMALLCFGIVYGLMEVYRKRKEVRKFQRQASLTK